MCMYTKGGYSHREEIGMQIIFCTVVGITDMNLTHKIYLRCKFIYLFGVLRLFQHCTGHITMGYWKGRGNQYIQFVRVLLYCKLPTNSKQLPAFPLEAVLGTKPWPQRWEARVLPLCHRGPYLLCKTHLQASYSSLNWPPP